MLLRMSELSNAVFSLILPARKPGSVLIFKLGHYLKPSRLICQQWADDGFMQLLRHFPVQYRI